MNIIRDTYFFDSSKALEVAMQKNSLMPLSNRYCSYKLFDYSAQDEYVQFDYKDMQICYYGGELLDNCPENLVHLPLESFYEFCLNTRYRLPQIVDFEGLDASELVKVEIYGLLKVLIEKVFADRKILIGRFIDSISTSRLDFNEPLRVFLVASRHTRVMQYCSRDIADAFMEMGFDVKFEIESNSMEVIENYHWLKSLSEYNPHVTININHMNNEFLNDAIFNVVWFQDMMPILHNSESLQLRDRDMLFSYSEMFDQYLKKKGVLSIHRQYICCSSKLFYDYIPHNRRNEAIAFVGSFYSDSRLLAAVKGNYEILRKLRSLIENGIVPGDNLISSITNDYSLELSLSDFNEIQQGLIRNICVEWLSQVDYCEKNIYGYDWDKAGVDSIASAYKGPATKNQVNILYNESKYVLLPSGRTINTQRLAEAITCGAIPIIYDSRTITKETEFWEDFVLYFKTKQELQEILRERMVPRNMNYSKMRYFFSYKSFVEQILHFINKFSGSC